MAEIFVSYARSTAKEAQAVAAALRGLGWDVWLDDDLPAHRAFTEVLEEKLRSADAVVVVWSAEAVKSEWVQAEADLARQAHKLVQLNVDDARLPLPFDRIQCANMTGWAGDTDAPGWRKVVTSVRDLVGDPAPAPRAARAVAQEAEPLLAVLPFDNLSGDPDLLYFSDGLSDEILQTVARTTRLKVIGRSSSFQFRGPAKAAKRVAAELNCTHLLDGSVRKSGSRVRVAASLVECARQTMLWSDRFDRDLSDVFALQDEIAAAVAEALNQAFAASPDVGPVDPRAYDLYLLARATTAGAVVGADAADWMTPADIGLLEQALARAPSWAQAWSELALAKAVLAQSQESVETFASLSAGARTAVKKTLSLDEHSAAAYLAQSLLLPPCGKFEEREHLMEAARSAGPSDELAQFQSSVFLTRVGRVREAFPSAAQAYQLSPLSSHTVFWYADALYKNGRHEDAFAMWGKGRTRWPTHPGMTSVAMFYAAAAGDWPRADALAHEARRLTDSGTASNLAAVEMLRDRPADALDQLTQLGKAQLAHAGTVHLEFVGFMSLMGFIEAAYDLIEAASFEHLLVAGDPRTPASGSPHSLFDAQNTRLRDDPRFIALCARLGLCAYWVRTNRWPDCAEAVGYDFKAESRRLTAA